MLPSVSNDRATPARSLHRKSSMPAQQKSGARDRVQRALRLRIACWF